MKLQIKQTTNKSSEMASKNIIMEQKKKSNSFWPVEILVSAQSNTTVAVITCNRSRDRAKEVVFYNITKNNQHMKILCYFDGFIILSIMWRC